MPVHVDLLTHLSPFFSPLLPVAVAVAIDAVVHPEKVQQGWVITTMESPNVVVSLNQLACDHFQINEHDSLGVPASEVRTLLGPSYHVTMSGSSFVVPDMHTLNNELPLLPSPRSFPGVLLVLQALRLSGEAPARLRALQQEAAQHHRVTWGFIHVDDRGGGSAAPQRIHITATPLFPDSLRERREGVHVGGHSMFCLLSSRIDEPDTP